jgi:hypothetical protein
VTIAIAKKEGWYSKSGSKWQTMPELMMRYRAATFLVRTTAPELTMGLPMQEEMEDIQPVKTVTIESLRQQQKIGSVIEVAEPITEDVVGGNL